MMRWYKAYLPNSILGRHLKKFYSTDSIMQTTSSNTETLFHRWIIRRELMKQIKRISQMINHIERLERQQQIYGWYLSYKKHNPQNTIRTNFFLAKMSYELSRKGSYVFTPYIPQGFGITLNGMPANEITSSSTKQDRN